MSQASDRVNRALTQPIKISNFVTTALVKGSKGQYYCIMDRVDQKRVTCTCPDFENRGDITDCKHIHHYRMQISSTRPACPYGASCYRQNLIHLQEYSHPVKQSDSQAVKSDE